MEKGTCRANANIALVKYWGKRDETLMLPQNGSISMTLDGMHTTTTVEFLPSLKADEVTLNDALLADGKEFAQVVEHLNIIREMAKIKTFARVASKNNFPTAAGLASSASGFAALSMAAAKAAGLKLNPQELSMLSRRGSGSASRSIHGGFVEWKRGEKSDGTDSYAQQIAPPSHWPNFRMLTTVVSTSEKKVKSRAGMKQTVETCPLYPGWLSSVNADLDAVRSGIKEKDFHKVGATAEHNCLKMHATMIATNPPIIYWNPATMEIIHLVQVMREEGVPVYFTIDAGPNVKVICQEENMQDIEARLKELSGVKNVHVCKPGGPAETLKEHLF
ncbi:Diphosphomevalonate decarboxylase [uncultured archaeon]|nr:Diphosphomevalonate decarboxylase [uncultured archaeon]